MAHGAQTVGWVFPSQGCWTCSCLCVELERSLSSWASGDPTFLTAGPRVVRGPAFHQAPLGPGLWDFRLVTFVFSCSGHGPGHSPK